MDEPDVHFIIKLYQKHTENRRDYIKMFHFVCLESHRIKAIYLELSRTESYNYGQESDLAIKRATF